MEDKNTYMVPILTTQAGHCLTGANWQEIGIGIASFYLTTLLMKPGFDFLKTLPNLASYVGWQGTLVLNASSLVKAADGRYTLRSHYDGSYLHYSIKEILTLIDVLQPDMLILPEGGATDDTWWKNLPDNVLPFVHVNDLSEYSRMGHAYGVYFFYDDTLIQRLQQYQGMPSYVLGELSLPVMRDLLKHGANYVESNVPASDAYLGNVYASEGLISLQHSTYKDNFDLIDKKCKCPICSQKLTRAYLHHLLEQTPLLCQRYLIQHNMYHCLKIYQKKEVE